MYLPEVGLPVPVSDLRCGAHPVNDLPFNRQQKTGPRFLFFSSLEHSPKRAAVFGRAPAGFACLLRRDGAADVGQARRGPGASPAVRAAGVARTGDSAPPAFLRNTEAQRPRRPPRRSRFSLSGSLHGLRRGTPPPAPAVGLPATRPRTRASSTGKLPKVLPRRWQKTRGRIFRGRLLRCEGDRLGNPNVRRSPQHPGPPRKGPAAEPGFRRGSGLRLLKHRMKSGGPHDYKAA